MGIEFLILTNSVQPGLGFLILVFICSIFNSYFAFNPKKNVSLFNSNNFQSLSLKMAFILPPLFTQRQPPNKLAIHKRRCESLPINFHDVNLRSESTSSILKEEEKTRISHPYKSKSSSSVPLKEKHQMPNSPIKTLNEWFFPNQSFTKTQLENNEMENTTKGKNGRKRVRFGNCEWVKYGEKEDEEEQNENEERENVDPNDSNKRMEPINGNQEDVEQTSEPNVDTNDNHAIPPIQDNNNRPRKRDVCPSIMDLNVAQQQQKEQNAGMIVNLMMSEKSNKYIALIFRIWSSLNTPKM